MTEAEERAEARMLADVLRKATYQKMLPYDLAQLILTSGYSRTAVSLNDAFDAGMEHGKASAFVESLG